MIGHNNYYILYNLPNSSPKLYINKTFHGAHYIEGFFVHSYDINVVYSLQNFTDCFTAFVDHDVIERCQQEKQLLDKLLEQVCTY